MGAFTAAVEPATPASGHLTPGYTIAGRFTVRSLLGEGASSAVYKVDDLATGLKLAAKVGHGRQLPLDETVERFEREARLCELIRSPHVPRVHEAGRLTDGSPFLVMDLVEGDTLSELLVAGPLPCPAAAEVAQQLLLALQAVHETGALHRDVKPENIVLKRCQGAAPVVTLVDFGICKPMSPAEDDLRITLDGVVVGTPHYMSPEQLYNRAPDERADVYATGAVLYEMLVGRPPYLGATLQDVIAAVLHDPVLPPGAVRRDCPRALDAVVLRALDRSRKRRYRSAGLMVSALGRVVRELGWPVGSDALQLIRPAPPRRGRARGPATRQGRGVPPPVPAARRLRTARGMP